MKKALFLIVSLIIGLWLVACTDTSVPENIATPSNVHINGDVISWDTIDLADGYIVIINQNLEYNVQQSSFDLSTLNLDYGTYTIHVVSTLLDLRSNDSESVTYVVDEMPIPIEDITEADINEVALSMMKDINRDYNSLNYSSDDFSSDYRYADYQMYVEFSLETAEILLMNQMTKTEASSFITTVNDFVNALARARDINDIVNNISMFEDKGLDASALAEIIYAYYVAGFHFIDANTENEIDNYQRYLNDVNLNLSILISDTDYIENKANVLIQMNENTQSVYDVVYGEYSDKAYYYYDALTDIRYANDIGYYVQNYLTSSEIDDLYAFYASLQTVFTTDQEMQRYFNDYANYYAYTRYIDRYEGYISRDQSISESLDQMFANVEERAMFLSAFEVVIDTIFSYNDAIDQDFMSELNRIMIIGTLTFDEITTLKNAAVDIILNDLPTTDDITLVLDAIDTFVTYFGQSDTEPGDSFISLSAQLQYYSSLAFLDIIYALDADDLEQLSDDMNEMETNDGMWSSYKFLMHILTHVKTYFDTHDTERTNIENIVNQLGETNIYRYFIVTLMDAYSSIYSDSASNIFDMMLDKEGDLNEIGQLMTDIMTNLLSLEMSDDGLEASYEALINTDTPFTEAASFIDTLARYNDAIINQINAAEIDALLSLLEFNYVTTYYFPTYPTFESLSTALEYLSQFIERVKTIEEGVISEIASIDTAELFGAADLNLPRETALYGTALIGMSNYLSDHDAYILETINLLIDNILSDENVMTLFNWTDEDILSIEGSIVSVYNQLKVDINELSSLDFEHLSNEDERAILDAFDEYYVYLEIPLSFDQFDTDYDYSLVGDSVLSINLYQQLTHVRFEADEAGFYEFQMMPVLADESKWLDIYAYNENGKLVYTYYSYEGENYKELAYFDAGDILYITIEGSFSEVDTPYVISSTNIYDTPNPETINEGVEANFFGDEFSVTFTPEVTGFYQLTIDNTYENYNINIQNEDGLGIAYLYNEGGLIEFKENQTYKILYKNYYNSYEHVALTLDLTSYNAIPDEVFINDPETFYVNNETMTTFTPDTDGYYYIDIKALNNEDNNIYIEITEDNAFNSGNSVSPIAQNYYDLNKNVTYTIHIRYYNDMTQVSLNIIERDDILFNGAIITEDVDYLLTGYNYQVIFSPSGNGTFKIPTTFNDVTYENSYYGQVRINGEMIGDFNRDDIYFTVSTADEVVIYIDNYRDNMVYFMVESVNSDHNMPDQFVANQVYTLYGGTVAYTFTPETTAFYQFNVSSSEEISLTIRDNGEYMFSTMSRQISKYLQLEEKHTYSILFGHPNELIDITYSLDETSYRNPLEVPIGETFTYYDVFDGSLIFTPDETAFYKLNVSQIDDETIGMLIYVNDTNIYTDSISVGDDYYFQFNAGMTYEINFAYAGISDILPMDILIDITDESHLPEVLKINQSYAFNTGNVFSTFIPDENGYYQIKLTGDIDEFIVLSDYYQVIYSEQVTDGMVNTMIYMGSYDSYFMIIIKDGVLVPATLEIIDTGISGQNENLIEGESMNFISSRAEGVFVAPLDGTYQITISDETNSVFPGRVYTSYDTNVNLENLNNYIFNARAGDELNLTVYDDGQPRIITMQVDQIGSDISSFTGEDQSFTASEDLKTLLINVDQSAYYEISFSDSEEIYRLSLFNISLSTLQTIESDGSALLDIKDSYDYALYIHHMDDYSFSLTMTDYSNPNSLDAGEYTLYGNDIYQLITPSVSGYYTITSTVSNLSLFRGYLYVSDFDIDQSSDDETLSLTSYLYAGEEYFLRLYNYELMLPSYDVNITVDTETQAPGSIEVGVEKPIVANNLIYEFSIDASGEYSIDATGNTNMIYMRLINDNDETVNEFYVYSSAYDVYLNAGTYYLYIEVTNNFINNLTLRVDAID